MKRRGDGTVWSSEHGRTCPHCGLPTSRCACRANPRAARGDGIVRVRREKKGRRGKTVTTISGIALPSDDLRDLASELKRHCGTGGSVVDGTIEIQGDHCDILIEALEAKGHTVKRAGG